MFKAIASLAAALLVLSTGAAQAKQTFEVKLAAQIDKPVTGRLFVIALPVTGDTPQAIETIRTLREALGASASPAVDSNSAMAALATVRLLPGGSVEVDGDLLAAPAFSNLKPGKFYVRAVLDVDGDYAYRQRPGTGDIVSKVVIMDLPSERPQLVLDQVFDAGTPRWDRPEPKAADFAGLSSPDRRLQVAKTQYDQTQLTKSRAQRIYLPSKILTAFYGRPTSIRAHVMTPPGYDTGSERYPVLLRMEGFSATFDSTADSALPMTRAHLETGRAPPMIWVFLDHSGPTGTHEFADSANNGTWGQALTEEFIPWLDKTYRTDGAPSGRFLTGHSSGGWAALWLQVRYPKMFGGAWPTAPDPSDFRNFTNIDIYAPGANAYRQPDGSPTPLVRANGKVAATFEEYARNERVLGDVGGQLASFEWVFSPRGPNGQPRQLFNRDTGVIDPQVAAYWRENYDISHIIRRDWSRLKPDLDSKIHLWVGTADTYYLDGSARLLQATLDELGAKSDFHFVPNATHGGLGVGRDSDNTYIFDALEVRLAWEMYALARPNMTLTPWKAPNPPRPANPLMPPAPAAQP